MRYLSHNNDGDSMKKAIRILTACTAGVCTFLFALILFGNAALPDEMLSYNSGDTSFYGVYGCAEASKTRTVNSQTGGGSEELRLFGAVPVKTVSVTHANRQTVLVSGEVFGIKLYTDGVIVVGTQSVDSGGKRVDPAEDSGIRVGDIIVSINGIPMFSSTDVKEELNDNNGADYKINIKRDGRYHTFTLTPAYSEREGCYKAGMWVRDSTAGIGTVTFYNPQQGTFASLGHQINDVDTNALVPLLEGEAVRAEITGVQKAQAGATGSLTCDFKEETIGQLVENCPCGLYGAYAQTGDYVQKYEIAPRTAVHRGKAQIISTVEAGKPQRYEVEITRVKYRGDEEQKDIVLRITDPVLLNKTGGIVQGMSGSPLIQDGKLVGALTHVVVNHPEKGYAVFAETMLKASELKH